MTRSTVLKALGKRAWEFFIGAGLVAIGVDFMEGESFSSWKYGQVGYGEYQVYVGAFFAVFGGVVIVMALWASWREIRSINR
ncbi:hypothetical protein [Arhodomonas sp. AD133]|uniref:hypothetical protein n=1 Tax=Arhodomonas sp. AD133 TaxID=3415009 RepID=UPI003EB75FA7